MRALNRDATHLELSEHLLEMIIVLARQGLLFSQVLYGGSLAARTDVVLNAFCLVLRDTHTVPVEPIVASVTTNVEPTHTQKQKK